MNNEVVETIEQEILKIKHDEELEKIFNKYPLEEYDVDIVSLKSLDARREKIVLKVTQRVKDNNKKIRL